VADLPQLLAGFRETAAKSLGSITPDSAWRLRSELHVLKAHLEAHPRDGTPELRAAVDGALALTGEAHNLALEFRSGMSDKGYAQFASLLDLGAIGTIALENLLVVERRRLTALLLAGLSELLTYLASREYVKGASARLASIARAEGPHLQDELWSALRRYRPKATAAELREAQGAIDRFFSKALAEGLPPEAQALIVSGVLNVLLRLRVVEILRPAG